MRKFIFFILSSILFNLVSSQEDSSLTANQLKMKEREDFRKLYVAFMVAVIICCVGILMIPCCDYCYRDDRNRNDSEEN